MDAGQLRGRPHVTSFADLAARLSALPPASGPVRLVAVDGPGGAGKSTFAGRLAGSLGGAPVVHTDDFASADSPIDWAPRLLDQVIGPLRGGRPGKYQRYDWVQQALAEWHDVPLAPVVVIEGVGAGRLEFAVALSFVIWIETPADLRVARGLERDGEGMLGFWQQWIADENAHFAADHTLDRVDLIVDGNPTLPHDPSSAFVARQPASGFGAQRLLRATRRSC
jgi:uridine kinase